MSTPSAATRLGEALFTKTQRALLPILFEQPDRALHLRELVRQCGTGPGAVQRELARLVAAGIVRRSVQGRQVCFAADRECPLYPELRELVTKALGMVHLLRETLGPLQPRIRWAFLFGSVARGEETNSSDVDLMVVGDVTLRDVVPPLMPLQEQFGREINPVVYGPEEFTAKARNDAHFVSCVLQSPRTMLVGDESELARLGKKRVAG